MSRGSQGRERGWSFDIMGLLLQVMLRRLILIATLLAVTAGSIGVPITISSCPMEGSKVRVGARCDACAPTGDVDPCSTSSEGKKGCCTTRQCLQHIDPARTIAPSIDIVPPVTVSLFVFHTEFFPTEPFRIDERLVDHPPPDLALRNARTWLRLSHLRI